MEGKEQPRQYNNGRRHTPATKRRARALRKNGTSYKDIAKLLGISSGSSHLWTSDIKLSLRKLQKIEDRRKAIMAINRVWTPAQRQEISRRLRPFRLKKQRSRRQLMREIKDFYRKNGRIPLKKEFNSRTTFRTQFGTWNNAIIAAGFKPNPVYFAERVIAQDGHVCDSFAERIIDDWLTANKIPHARNVRYPNSKMTVDFFLEEPKIFIEFFGLHGANRKYNINHQRKLGIAKRNRLKMIALYMDDILQKTYIPKIKAILTQKMASDANTSR